MSASAPEPSLHVRLYRRFAVATVMVAFAVTLLADDGPADGAPAAAPTAYRDTTGEHWETAAAAPVENPPPPVDMLADETFGESEMAEDAIDPEAEPIMAEGAQGVSPSGGHGEEFFLD